MSQRPPIVVAVTLLALGCGGGMAEPGAPVGEPDLTAPVGPAPEDLAAPRDLGSPPRDLARPRPDLAEEQTPDDPPDAGAPVADLAVADQPAPGGIVVGGPARVTAGMLNLRSGPSTMFQILTAMPCGAKVDVVGGPQSGWWQIKYQGQTGWSSGTYLVAEKSFNPAVCGGAPVDGGADGKPPLQGSVKEIFDRAKLAVGYSYWWGHGNWRGDGAQHGSCVGNCPNCSHNGGYGADCSGFVAKCWQIPNLSPITQDLHPYSTYNFYNQTTHWSKLARGSLKPADALVYNANGAGHIVLYESGDPWGAMWLYEARGCSYGIVHNLRTVDKSYIAIRREGL